MYMSAKFDLD